MKIILFGHGVRGERIARVLVDSGYSVEAFVGVPPEEESSLAAIAREQGIPFLCPDRVNDADSVKALRALNPDLFILTGYNKILKPAVLDIPPLKTINLHAGKLPKYRGTAPINWQLINNETIGAFTILYADEGIDTGAILAEEEYEITDADTAATIVNKSLEVFPKLLLQVLDRIKLNTLNPVEQDVSSGSYYTRRYPEDGAIYWHRMSDREVFNLVRALVPPYPGAFTYYQGKKILILKTSLLNENIHGVPGRIVFKRAPNILVTCMNRAMQIEEIQLPDGQTPLPSKYFKLGAAFSSSS